MSFENIPELNSVFNGKTFTDVRLFSVNEAFIAFDDQNLVVVEGGIELDFGDTRLTIGWNSEMEQFDIIINDKISSLIGDLEYYEIEDSAIADFLQDHTIVSVDSKWNWYRKTDDELEPIGPKLYIPYEIILQLDNGKSLQIAAVFCNWENDTIEGLCYDSQGQLLISIDKIINIKHSNYSE